MSSQSIPYGSKLSSASLLILGMEGLILGGLMPVSKAAIDAAGTRKDAIDKLQELGGWSDYSMVYRYAHLSVEHLAKYADNLSQGRPASTKLAQSAEEEKEKRTKTRLTA